MKPNFEALRDWLIEYYGIAMTNGNPQAVIDLEEVKTTQDSNKLLEHAARLKVNLDDFAKY